MYVYIVIRNSNRQIILILLGVSLCGTFTSSLILMFVLYLMHILVFNIFIYILFVPSLILMSVIVFQIFSSVYTCN